MYFFCTEIIIITPTASVESIIYAIFIDSFGKCHGLSDTHKSVFAGFKPIFKCHLEMRDSVESTLVYVSLNKSNWRN